MLIQSIPRNSVLDQSRSCHPDTCNDHKIRLILGKVVKENRILKVLRFNLLLSIDADIDTINFKNFNDKDLEQHMDHLQDDYYLLLNSIYLIIWNIE